MTIVNKPQISKWLTGFYARAFYFSVQASAISAAGAVGLVVVLGFVEGVMVWLAVSIHRTTYILTDDELVLKAPRLIGGNKRIPLETVASVHRTLIPFGVRILGASFYSGYYYFPNVGKSFMVITNFRDGVLIKAQHGNQRDNAEKTRGFHRKH